MPLHAQEFHMTACFVALNVDHYGCPKVQVIGEGCGNRWAMLAVKGLAVGGCFWVLGTGGEGASGALY